MGFELEACKRERGKLSLKISNAVMERTTGSHASSATPQWDRFKIMPWGVILCTTKLPLSTVLLNGVQRITFVVNSYKRTSFQELSLIIYISLELLEQRLSRTIC